MTSIFDEIDSANSKPRFEAFDGHFDPIIPFDQYETPEIPPGLLPQDVGDFVENIADVLSIPTAMPVMAAIGIIAAALCTKFVVSPKPDWCEPVNIYSITAMPPASNKSQTLSYLKKPVDEWEKFECNRIAPKRQEAITELKILQQQLAKYYNIIKAKKSKAEEISLAQEKIQEIESELQEKQSAIPKLPQIYTTDATPEAIADLVNEQDGRLGIISDEGGITEVLSGLYNSGNANIDIFLKGIDGGATRIKRAHKDYRLNPYLTVLLLVQPQILSNMADKRAFTGNGALERFLFTLPVGNVGYREIKDTTIDEHYKDKYSKLVFNLLAIPVPAIPQVLTLEAPALAVFTEFRAEIERSLRPDGKLHICRAWGGKLAGYTLRLAAIFHLSEHCNPKHLIIQKSTMNNAITLARLLMDHAVAAFSLMGTDEEITDAKSLYEWLKTQKVRFLKKSEIINAMRNRHMGKKKRLQAALANLIERNFLSTAHLDCSTRKPTEVYFVNPNI